MGRCHAQTPYLGGCELIEPVPLLGSNNLGRVQRNLVAINKILVSSFFPVIKVVKMPMRGLEPPHLAATGPKPVVSTQFHHMGFLCEPFKGSMGNDGFEPPLFRLTKPKVYRLVGRQGGQSLPCTGPERGHLLRDNHPGLSWGSDRLS